MKELVISKETTERAVLVGLITQQQSEQKVKEYLDELEFLADTAGAQVVARFTQKVENPIRARLSARENWPKSRSSWRKRNRNGYFRRRSLVEAGGQYRKGAADQDSRPIQPDSRHFAKRAQTATAKTQVELAQYQYLLPRLTRMWTHLERQRGGIGMRGPGETQIETDRRIILRRISLLKEELRDIDRQKTLQRKNRGKLTRVALVGYTN